MVRYLRVLTLLSLPVTLVACERSKSSNPLSPNVAGAMGGVSVLAPHMVSPSPGATISDRDQPLTIVMGNPETNSPRPMTLGFQVAYDAAFANIAASREGLTPGADGQTRTVLSERLPPGRSYFWRTKADDGANSSGWAGAATFDLQPSVVIGAPNPVSPANNDRVTTAMPTLLTANAEASGPYGPLTYQFQVSENPTFNGLVVNAEIGPATGQTSYTIVNALAYNQSFYWRVRLFDPSNVGAWSRVEAFRSPLTPVIAPPPPPVDPGGGGDVSACGPPSLFNPLAILNCHRAFFPGGVLHGGSAVAFLSAAAKSLSAAGVPGGPFGILRKAGGNNCNGYSCDILCAGQGSAQRQWDVLIAEEVPTWGGSNGVENGIRVDVCEIK